MSEFVVRIQLIPLDGMFGLMAAWHAGKLYDACIIDMSGLIGE